MTKEQLRLNYHKLRQALSADAIPEKSMRIANNVVALPIWRATYFHTFLSIPSQKEVDTNYIIPLLQGKDKQIVIPKISGANSLDHYLLTDATTLKPNQWDIPEPTDGIEVPLEKIDVVFVPLLAFDLDGHRVGYGKGFYDKFLGECRPDVIRIGLSFFEAEAKISDVRSEDIALDYCVTPISTYTFSDVSSS
ncbi:MAG: 5-formyltetrahydrofolate cyclo-ligase [Eudoraea sp.]|nr:5-formyltetrahydrofolate cyclo-ligase [Eudoraea sp.]